jgi:hypothetical protein
MTVTILEDGTVKVECGVIGGAEHMAAEKMLMWIAEQMGGKTTRIKEGHTHQYGHHHHHHHHHAHIKR